MSLASLLPKPKHSHYINKQEQDKEKEEVNLQIKEDESTVGPPPYRKRTGWIPKTLKDFGDGGAFPEILVAQFPADLGKSKKSGVKSGVNNNSVPLKVSEEGKIQYDVILRSNSSEKNIQHQLSNIKPIDTNTEFSRPSKETVEETTKRTKEALDRILYSKTKSKNIKSAVALVTDQQKKPEYFKYTPQQPEITGIKNRIIRMVEAPVDPFEPPRFKHAKNAYAPTSPPPPVLHSPPRKITAEEQKEWFIPPAISNWKNPKGYTIPLDKRLASDGKDLQEIGINERFASFAEALFVAERHAREEVEKRNLLNKKLAEREKEVKEEKLRELAMRAREQQYVNLRVDFRLQESSRFDAQEDAEGEEDLDEGLRERNRIRAETSKQIKKQAKLAHMSEGGKLKMAAKALDRDVTERIALNQTVTTTNDIYDQRLFNQDGGIGHGFSADDAYNIYDRPLFTSSAVNAIYKPKSMNNEDDVDVDEIVNADRFVPAKGFQGADSSAKRDGPVEFEKADVFGIEELIDDVRHEVDTKKRRRDDTEDDEN